MKKSGKSINRITKQPKRDPTSSTRVFSNRQTGQYGLESFYVAEWAWMNCRVLIIVANASATEPKDVTWFLEAEEVCD